MKTRLTLLLLSPFLTYCQSIVDVTDQTLKIGGMKEEILYFGFAEGDQIILNFSEVDGKELKEIEIAEYPSNAKFTDFRSAAIVNKMITVSRKAVYRFRFSNGAVGGRICKIRIQRIPVSEQTKDFNTAVTWTTRQDTTWNTYTRDVLVGYDTTWQQVTKKELVKTEISEELLFDKNQRVHSELNSSGNRTSIFFTLPQPKTDVYETSKVVAWAYWVGVGQEAANAWERSAQSIGKLAEGIASMYITPLGAYAVGALTDMLIPTNGDNVYYGVTNQLNKDLFMAGQQFTIYDQGEGTGGFNKFTDARMCKGTFFIVMSNDNDVYAIDVTVKAIAIVETNTYEDKEYTEEIIEPRYEKKIFSDPVIITKTVPVIAF